LTGQSATLVSAASSKGKPNSSKGKSKAPGGVRKPQPAKPQTPLPLVNTSDIEWLGGDRPAITSQTALRTARSVCSIFYLSYGTVALYYITGTRQGRR
jgi:hypothetical protein